MEMYTRASSPRESHTVKVPTGGDRGVSTRGSSLGV